MRKKLIAYLKRPHPFIFEWYSAILPAGITGLLVVALQPFGIQGEPLASILGWALWLSLLVMVSIGGVVHSIRWLFPKWSAEENWILGKELLLFFLVLLVIAAAIFLYFLSVGISAMPTVRLFWQVLVKTVLIGILPVVILVLFEQNNHQKIKLRKARAWNDELQQKHQNQLKGLPGKHPQNASGETVVFKAENGKVALRLFPAEVLILKSDGNYVEIYFKKGKGEIEKKLIRNRLKHFVADLSPEIFFHCHHRYVINAKHIMSVKGNARNFELRLRGWEGGIPVSRAKAALLSDYLA